MERAFLMLYIWLHHQHVFNGAYDEAHQGTLGTLEPRNLEIQLRLKYRHFKHTAHSVLQSRPNMGTPSYGGAIALSFIGGFLAAIVIISIIAFTTLRMSDAYGLGHWKLNVKMPLSTMWMNLGYW